MGLIQCLSTWASRILSVLGVLTFLLGFALLLKWTQKGNGRAPKLWFPPLPDSLRKRIESFLIDKKKGLDKQLQNAIIKCLQENPMLKDSNGYKTVVFEAGLDEELVQQLLFDTQPSAIFVPDLIKKCIGYGTLNDGRDALIAVLEASKRHVGIENQKEYEKFVKTIRDAKETSVGTEEQQESEILIRKVEEHFRESGIEGQISPKPSSKGIMQSMFIILLILMLGIAIVRIFFPPSVPRPYNLVEQVDFRKSSERWRTMEVANEKWHVVRRLDDAGKIPRCKTQEIIYPAELYPVQWRFSTVKYPKPIQADLISAQVYFPDNKDINESWGQISILNKPGEIPITTSVIRPFPLGKWTHIVMDLRGKYDENREPLNKRSLYVDLNFAFKGHSTIQSTMIPVRVGSITWYTGVGDHSFRAEQRGTGQTLFNFENESVEPWTVHESRRHTDTLDTSFGLTYRGHWALQLNATKIVDNDPARIETLHTGPHPNGAWIAQVYLPDDPPPKTYLWAGFYTHAYSDSAPNSDSAPEFEWTGGPAYLLTPGKWNTLVWDTHDVRWDSKEDVLIGIQIGTDDEEPYTGSIYIDDVEFFER